MNTIITTSELPLATKLMREGAAFRGAAVQQGRRGPYVEFTFHNVNAQLLDDYRTGADGIVQYETSRKMLLRIIEVELEKHRAKHETKGPT